MLSYCFCFFKQKTAYEMRISDWSSDVCSSDLTAETYKERVPIQDYNSLKPYIDRMIKGEQNILWPSDVKWFAKSSGTTADRSKFKIGRASCRERVCQYV